MDETSICIRDYIKEVKEEVRIAATNRLASTLQIKAQAAKEDLETEFYNAKHVAESEDKDFLRTAGYQEEQLHVTIES